MNTTTPQPRPPAQPLAKALAVAIVIAALTASGYVVFVKGPSDLGRNVKDGTIDAAKQGYDLAKEIGRDISSTLKFQPKISVAGTTVVEASRDIAELATVTKSFEHTYSSENTWLGSTKRIKLKGYFVAKAGYDLTKPFSINLSADHQTIHTTMPPARLLSIEQSKFEILQDDNGLWNKISQEDRQSAINALLADARKSLESTTLLADADKALTTQLEAAIRKSAPPTVTITREPLP